MRILEDSQRFDRRRDQHVTNGLRNWMTYGTIKIQSAIGEHLLNNLECPKKFKNNMFSIICKGRNMYN